jgi:hypothetical protein
LSPAAGVWEASRRGQHAGRIERVNGSYHAMNARGRALGAFDDLDSARTAIDGGPNGRPGLPHAERVIMAVLWGVIAGGTAVAAVLVIALFRVGG